MESQKSRVIVTSSASLEQGFGRHVARQFLSAENNTIVFTEKTTLENKCYGHKILSGAKAIHDLSFERIRTPEDDAIVNQASVQLVNLKKEAQTTTKNSEDFVMADNVAKNSNYGEQKPLGTMQQL